MYFSLSFYISRIRRIPEISDNNAMTCSLFILKGRLREHTMLKC